MKRLLLMCLNIRFYKLEYIPNVQAVEAIEKNFDRLKDSYARSFLSYFYTYSKSKSFVGMM